MRSKLVWAVFENDECIFSSLCNSEEEVRERRQYFIEGDCEYEEPEKVYNIRHVKLTVENIQEAPDKSRQAALQAFKDTYGEIVGDVITDDYPDAVEFIRRYDEQMEN